MIPSPRTPKEACHYCMEVYAIEEGTTVELAQTLCRALRAKAEGNMDVDAAGRTDAAYRLFNRVSGFFGRELLGEDALKAGLLLDELDEMASAPEGAKEIWEVVAEWAESAHGLRGNRVYGILRALKGGKPLDEIEPKQSFASKL